MFRPLGLASDYLTITHSLRCGLQIYRRLRRLVASGLRAQLELSIPINWRNWQVLRRLLALSNRL